MLIEELGLRLSNPLPMKSALITFGAFCVVGVVPLLPFVISIFSQIPHMYWMSAGFTFSAFFLLGFFKGHFLRQKKYVTGLETLFLGGGAALIAYLVGYLLQIFL